MVKSVHTRRLIFTVLFLCAALLGLDAQEGLSSRIEMVESRNFPKVETIVNAEDETGAPILSLVRSNFQVRVDADIEIEDIDLERFAATERPIHYYILLSNSGIMEGAPLAMQKEAVYKIIDALRPQDTLSVYAVGSEPLPIIESSVGGEVDATPLEELAISDKQAKLFDSLIGLSRIVKEESLDRSAVKGRSVIITLSDGRDQESRSTLDDVVASYEDLGFPIYSVGIRMLGAQYLNIMNSLSTRTGGYYHYSSKVEGVPDRTDAILEQISMAYLVIFRVKGLPADDERHQLMVQVVDKEERSEAYKNFTAVKVPFPFWLKIAVLIAVFLLIVLFILLTILSRRKERKAMGIGKRRCPDCGRRMKDDWEFCPFCRYLKNDKKRKKRQPKDKEKKSK